MLAGSLLVLESRRLLPYGIRPDLFAGSVFFFYVTHIQPLRFPAVGSL